VPYSLCIIYNWLMNLTMQVTIRSLVSSKASPVIATAAVVVSFAYIGITLLAWVTLGIFHPNVRCCTVLISSYKLFEQFSTFRLSAETFYGLTLGDGLIPVSDNILPQSPQYVVFVTSRVIIGIYGLLFSIVLLSVIIAIVSMAVEEKVQCVSR